MRRLVALAPAFLFALRCGSAGGGPHRLLESAQAWTSRGSTSMLRESDAKRRCIFPRRRFLGAGSLGAGE